MDKVLSGRYPCVLTLLNHNEKRNRMHTSEYCRQLLANEKKIPNDKRIKAMSKILGPADVGIDQREIDDYYQFIMAWLTNRAPMDNNIDYALAMQIKMAKYSDGIYVPKNFLLT